MYLQQCFPHIFFLLTQDNLPRLSVLPLQNVKKFPKNSTRPRNEPSKTPTTRSRCYFIEKRKLECL